MVQIKRNLVNLLGLLTLLTFLMAGCSAAPATSTPDIQVTVEARVAPALVDSITPTPVATPTARRTHALTSTSTPVPTANPTATTVSQPIPPNTPSKPPVSELTIRESGIKFLENGQLEKAIQSFSKYIQSHPTDLMSLVLRSDAYRASFEFQNALDDLNIALGIPLIYQIPEATKNQENDHKKTLFTMIGLLSFELDLLDDAIRNLDHYLDVDEKTITASEAASHLETQQSIQWLIDGNGYLDTGLYREAIENFTAFIECSWNGSPSSEYLSDLIYPKGCGHNNYHNNIFLDYSEAYPQGSHPIGYFRRAIALKGLGEVEKALIDFKQVIELDSNNDRKYAQKAYRQKGVIYGGLGQHERAIQDFDEAINCDPQDAGTYANRGLTYYKLAQYERAIQDYDEAIHLNPEFGYAYYHRGGAYRAIGDLESAVRDLAKAKELRD